MCNQLKILETVLFSNGSTGNGNYEFCHIRILSHGFYNGSGKYLEMGGANVLERFSIISLMENKFIKSSYIKF